MNNTVVILCQTKLFQEDYQRLFKSYFKEVYIQHDLINAIHRIKQQCLDAKSTLLLVDLDAIHYDDIIQFLENSVRELNTLLPNYHIPLVVCSKIDSTNLMLDCIHAGATDYLLKPLFTNAIKTLFLRLHTCKFDKTSVNSSQSTTLLSSSNLLFQPFMNETNLKNTHLSKIMMKILLPKSLRYQAKTLFHVSIKRSSELKLKISSWDFSPFDLNQSELIHCANLIFEQVLTLEELKDITLTKDQLQNFIIDLANVYHDENPYHNFNHAVDVLQCLYFILCKLGLLSFSYNSSKKPKRHSLQNMLKPKHLFALLIAAIGHDAAHPGVNNMFLINSSNPLATLYNDRSVLESLHSMTLFQLLNKHGIIQLMGNPHSGDYKEFRKIIISSILSTDMSLHSDYLTKIQQKLPQEDVFILCSALIKCADISNVARPFHSAAQWAHLLVEEFISQGDLERELGIPVMPMNDRDKVILEDSQIGFIESIALDLFQSVHSLFDDISFAIDQIQANLKQWKTYKNQSLLSNSGVIMETEDTEMIGTKRRSNTISLELYFNTPHKDVYNKRVTIEKNHTPCLNSSSLHYHQIKLEDDSMLTEERLQKNNNYFNIRL